LATVRIYKVAELLGMSSQEATTLLKQETGIDVKGASSSIEEIVARQFVERHARKKQITLPPGPLFSDAPAPKKPGKAPEPPKPVAPVLRPRLIKVVKPAAVPGEAESEAGAHAAPLHGEEHVEPEPPPVTVEVPEMVAAVTEVSTPHAPVEVEAAAEPAPAAEPKSPPPVAAPVHTPVHTHVAAPPAAPAPVIARPLGRIVPPTRRLRIEDPLTGEAPAARPIPQRPVVRPQPSVSAPTRPAAPGTSPRPTARGPL
jgi:hypothetical protein